MSGNTYNQAELSHRVDGLEERIEKTEADVIVLRKGFPADDAEGHRRYHEAIIERTEEIRKLRQSIQEKTLSGLLWSALVFAGASVLHYVKDYFAK